MKVNLNHFLVILFGLVFLGVGAWLAYSDYVASTWDVVQGEVTHSTVGIEYDYSDEDIDYFADIEYTYQFKGQKYSGSCCDWRTEKYFVQGFVDKHKSGSTTELYVNPEKPQESRLKEDVNPLSWFNLIFMAMGGITALAGAYQLFKDIRSEEKIG